MLAGLLVPSPESTQAMWLGFEIEAEMVISRSCLVLGDATGNSFPALVSPRLQGRAGINGHVLILILKTHPGKINFGENSSLGQAGSEYQPDSLPAAGAPLPHRSVELQDST